MTAIEIFNLILKNKEIKEEDFSDDQYSLLLCFFGKITARYFPRKAEEIKSFIFNEENGGFLIELAEKFLKYLTKENLLLLTETEEELAQEIYIELNNALLAMGLEVAEKLGITDDITLHSSDSLVFAAIYGYEGVVKLLLNSGADINQETCPNSTTIETSSALEMALEHGHNQIAKLLLLKGANFNRKAFSIAHKKGSIEIINILKAIPIMDNLISAGEIPHGLDKTNLVKFIPHKYIEQFLIERGFKNDFSISDLISTSGPCPNIENLLLIYIAVNSKQINAAIELIHEDSLKNSSLPFPTVPQVGLLHKRIMTDDEIDKSNQMKLLIASISYGTKMNYDISREIIPESDDKKNLLLCLCAVMLNKHLSESSVKKIAIDFLIDKVNDDDFLKDIITSSSELLTQENVIKAVKDGILDGPLLEIGEAIKAIFITSSTIEGAAAERLDGSLKERS
jgi:ankyrin repeat protein